MHTVEKILNLAPFKSFKLVAGENGIHNKVTGVNILDNPDALDWLSSGEIVITSGYFFSENTEVQERFIKSFKKINCSAICIKPQAYLKTIPQTMKQLADELALPIIEIPYGIPFSKILTIIMSEISGRMNELNQMSLDIHSQFFEISLHGGGMQKIAQGLANMVENPIILVDTSWKVLMTVEQKGSSIAASLIPLEENFLFPIEQLATLPEHFERVQKPFTRHLTLNGIEITCILMPVYFDTIHYGSIIVYQMGRPLNDSDYIALENGSMAFALEQNRLVEIERTENRIRRDFFDQLLHGQIETLTQLNDFHSSLDPALDYTVLIFSIDIQLAETENLVRKKQSEDRLMKSLSAAFSTHTQTKYQHVHAFSKRQQLIVLLGTDKKLAMTNLHKKITTIAEELVIYLEITQKYPIHVYCAIGSTTPLLQTSKSYREAKKVIAFLKNHKKDQWIYHFNDFYFEAFLEDTISEETAQAFSHHYLDALISYDQENGTELVKTLNVYLNNHLNIAVTSRKLFIHRNTLLYRVEKIKTLTQLNMEQEENTLALRLALKLYKEI
ncbi:PucR family transcriptional regulator [Carnobacterium gallinarum]|uniref:PucR family transcriptional regulator n=1 Tax=Carnobacterium gallinarum TaxID=2749 RepID=UPI00054EDD86|nr:PucR family transcriptional regulator [Carnobacterium gallinarum]